MCSEAGCLSVETDHLVSLLECGAASGGHSAISVCSRVRPLLQAGANVKTVCRGHLRECAFADVSLVTFPFCGRIRSTDTTAELPLAPGTALGHVHAQWESSPGRCVSS